MSIHDDDIVSTHYLLSPSFQKQEEKRVRTQHKCLEIPKLFRDREFSNPPYDIHSEVACKLDNDKCVKCVMAMMIHHAIDFIDAYNAIIP